MCLLTCSPWGLSFWFGRFDTWLSSHLKLPLSSLLSYSGNYTDDAKSWRLVDITRLASKYRHDRADKRICTALLKTKTCSLERALRRTPRFQKWLRAKRLTPDLVQVCVLWFWCSCSPLAARSESHAVEGCGKGLVGVGLNLAGWRVRLAAGWHSPCVVGGDVPPAKPMVQEENDALTRRKVSLLKAKPSQPRLIPWHSLSRAGMGLAPAPGSLCRWKSCGKSQHQVASGAGITMGCAHKCGNSSSGEIAAAIFFP